VAVLSTKIFCLLLCLCVSSVASKTVVASFDNTASNKIANGVSGTITLSQASASASTTITVSLAGLPAAGPAKWHVHVFPIATDCSSAAGHFNPLNAAGTCTPSVATNNSICEVGDLSGKHGSFVSTTASATYTDVNLPLFGKNSVVGRSIVIHDNTGARYACASIGYPSMVRTVVSTFNGPEIYGTITMKQDAAMSSAETTILVDLNRMDSAGNTVTSTGHGWHAHVTSVITPTGKLGSTNCANGGGHYNPFGVTGTCNPMNITTCEVGDLSGKLGTLSFPATGGNRKFFTTPLPLSGMYSVAMRSIVVHGASGAGARIGCADTSSYAVAMFQGAISGSISFKQASSKDNTTLKVMLSGTTNAGGYHVHTLPLSAGSCASATGHFNPLNATGTCNPAMPSTCEIGDLSGKFGALSGSSVNAMYSDANLPLFGMNSIVGRSVVIHASGTGARIACADIRGWDPVKEVKSMFSGSAVMGTITVRQAANNPQADTQVLVNIYSPAGATTMNGYHVHQEPVLGRACSATGGHYNPNMAVTCVPSSPWSCEVGDLSGKHSKLDLAATAGTRSFYTDLLLPVTGTWSIANRSIVVHNSAGARIACATTVMTPPSMAPAPAPGGMGPAPAPAPKAPAPAPAPMAPAPAATATPVKVSLTLSGVTAAVANTASVKTAITNTIASSIGVSASKVTITSITAARRLSVVTRRLASSVVVAFEVAVADVTQGTSVKSSFTKTSGSNSTFLTTLSSSLSSSISVASGTTVTIGVTSAAATGGTVPMPAPSDNDDDKKGLSGGVVAIIVIIVLAVVGAGAFYGYQKMQGMDSGKDETAEKHLDAL
jgi:Cu/Zn superoxide dismutase/Na+-transporting NADH:ubiquinone oxidoreductase subunit NqrD